MVRLIASRCSSVIGAIGQPIRIVKHIIARASSGIRNRNFDININMSAQIEFSKLKDNDTVMLLNCDDDDYIGGDGGPNIITMTFKKFVKDVLREYIDGEDITNASEAYECFEQDSGDRDENHYLILVRNGKGYAVIADDME